MPKRTDKELDNTVNEARAEAQAIYDWTFDDSVGQKARALFYTKWEVVAFIWYRLGGARLIRLVPKEVISLISEEIFCMGYREREKEGQIEALKKLMNKP